MNGRLDEVALYATALSSAQIAGHYALRASVDTPMVVTLPLVAVDPDGNALSYGATGRAGLGSRPECGGKRIAAAVRPVKDSANL